MYCGKRYGISLDVMQNPICFGKCMPHLKVHASRLLSFLAPNNKTMHACHPALVSVSAIRLVSAGWLSRWLIIGLEVHWRLP
jgi:hypothetical protein